MKLLRLIFFVAISFALSRNVSGQGFVNFDFENPILPLMPVYFQVPASQAIPGWTVYMASSTYGTNQLEQIVYNTIDLGGGGAFLEDANAPSGGGPPPIQGAYSVLLHGSRAAGPYTFSIGQTGPIPLTAQSLTFFAQAYNYQVTFNGQLISFNVLSNAANYSVYGADISNYAGQTGELLFSALGYSQDTSAGYLLLDNIQFSSTPIPEPSVLGLLALSGILFGLRRSN